MAILKAKQIKKRFSGINALVDGNLTCKEGKITGLLGANGCGKSTISKIIAGVYIADNGEITYNGKQINYKHPIDARRDGISLAFQNLSLVPDLNVWQNIILGMEEKKGFFRNDDAAKEQARVIVQKLMPNIDIQKKVNELRPGEMQIVEVAKAIFSNPKLLILDEPTAALDKEEVGRLFNYMRELAQKGVAMIFTSHRMNEVMEICDEVSIFKNGANVCNIDFDVEKRDDKKIISFIADETNKSDFEERKNYITHEVCLKVENLNFGDVLKDISFELKKGEVLGIGGLAGQGQRELLLALSGVYRIKNANIKLFGKKIKLHKPANAIENGILLVPGDRQQEGLFLSKSVYYNLIFPKVISKKYPLVSRKKYKKLCSEKIDQLGIIAGDIDMPVNDLSGGNQQKVVVGKWLNFDTKVILLDDPAKGVDVGAKKDLYLSYLQQVKEKQISIILYASDNQELIEYCDRVIVMCERKFVQTLEGDDITDNKIIDASISATSNTNIV